MSQLGITVIGAGGRMGSEVRNLVAQNPESYQLSGAVDPQHEEFSNGLDEVDASQTDVVVDFSAPESFLKALDWCERHGKPIVSGTTGFSKEQSQKIEESSKQVALLWAPNMSLGVCVLKKMLSYFSSLDEFDYQIEEFHHNRKKDKPSGTALSLQETLENVLGRELPEALSVRGGGIYGIHKIWAMSDEEVVGLQHTALNRQVFARGALKAARWLQDQSPGFYQMEDVLNLK